MLKENSIFRLNELEAFKWIPPEGQKRGAMILMHQSTPVIQKGTRAYQYIIIFDRK